MARLLRPHIPLCVRVQVAYRQVRESGATTAIAPRPDWSAKKNLDFLLEYLFGDEDCELHHRPALVNRIKVMNRGVHVGYKPAANGPDGLVYLMADDHDVETRVRGQRGAHSDLAQARKNKNIARNRSSAKPKSKIQSRPFQNRNVKWPKRHLRAR